MVVFLSKWASKSFKILDPSKDSVPDPSIYSLHPLPDKNGYAPVYIQDESPVPVHEIDRPLSPTIQCQGSQSELSHRNDLYMN